jgi:hypothetical protein
MLDNTNPLVSISSRRARLTTATDIDDVDAFDAEMQAAKETWVRARMAEREREFCQFREFRLCMGTWNVNGRDATQSLKPWLADVSVADIYAIG